MGRFPIKHGTDQNGVKKGPWSVEEDEKLVAYIRRYGIWNWNEMARPAGLSRTGKSCRLRWMNYLRPNIRHGNITKEEEEIIVKWHQLLGNRWSAIAAKLHGRTDNEIKNYWNTRLKRRYGGNNIRPHAVNPPNFPATTCPYEQNSIHHSSGISITPVHNGSSQADESNLHESIFRKAPAVATNDFCPSSSPYSSSNDTGLLGLNDELQTLMTQLFPTYMALDGYYHEKSGHTSTLVASQDIDGTTDLMDQHIIFDLWE